MVMGWEQLTAAAGTHLLERRSPLRLEVRRPCLGLGLRRPLRLCLQPRLPRRHDPSDAAQLLRHVPDVLLRLLAHPVGALAADCGARSHMPVGELGRARDPPYLLHQLWHVSRLHRAADTLERAKGGLAAVRRCAHREAEARQRAARLPDAHNLSDVAQLETPQPWPAEERRDQPQVRHMNPFAKLLLGRAAAHRCRKRVVGRGQRAPKRRLEGARRVAEPPQSVFLFRVNALLFFYTRASGPPFTCTSFLSHPPTHRPHGPAEAIGNSLIAPGPVDLGLLSDRLRGPK